MSPNQIADKSLRDRLLYSTPTTHHDQVRSLQNAPTCGSTYDEPARGGQRTLLYSANPIAIPVLPSSGRGSPNTSEAIPNSKVQSPS